MQNELSAYAAARQKYLDAQRLLSLPAGDKQHFSKAEDEPHDL